MIRSRIARVVLLVALVHLAQPIVPCGFAADSAAPQIESPKKAASKKNAASRGMDSVTGRLVPNRDAEKTGAPYAVLDSSGEVAYYLRPSGNMDLSRHVDRRVQVSGRKIASPAGPNPLMEVKEVAPASTGRREATLASHNAPAPNTSAPAPEATITPQPMPEEGFVDDGGGWEGEAWDDDGGPSCGGCGAAGCMECGGCGPPGLVWVRGEYLYWWSAGMRVPPLVTTGPSAEQPGFLNTPGTTILFGGEPINGYGRSGFRVTLGTWLDCSQRLGVEGDYYMVDAANTTFTASSGGTPVLSRPFFDLSPTQANPELIVGQNVEQVASPDSISGSVAVDAQTRFQSAGIRMRLNLCCSNDCFDSCYPTLAGPGYYRLDFLLGYRYAQLSDSVTINENLNSLLVDNPGQFRVNDSFGSLNTFNGIELGTLMQRYRGRWSVELLSKIAFGNVHELVNINGFTTTTQNGSTVTDVGGLLAQRTNIGKYERDQFAVMPELGANVGFQLTPRLRAIVGYTFVYLSRAARAGEQIDLDVNSRLLPNDTRPLGGDLRHPAFVWQDTQFWAQGVNVGLDYRW